MPNLVDLIREFKNFELAKYEEAKIKEVYYKRKSILDVVEIAGFELVEWFVKNMGLGAQLTSIVAGLYGSISPKQVALNLIVSESAKWAIHYNFKVGPKILDYIHRKQDERRDKMYD